MSDISGEFSKFFSNTNEADIVRDWAGEEERRWGDRLDRCNEIRYTPMPNGNIGVEAAMAFFSRSVMIKIISNEDVADFQSSYDVQLS